VTSEERIRQALSKALAQVGASGAEVHLERPRDSSHGDLASNVAMTLASRLRRSPRQIAEALVQALDVSEAGVTGVEIAGPGFLNFRLAGEAIADGLRDVLALDEAYGRSAAGAGERVMVEWVSANPTGPLHLGHGRQAALGDAICHLLEWTGWAVHREFYYNDSGKQMALLGASVWARYQQALHEPAEVPEGGYNGQYVVEIARSLLDEVGDRYRNDGSAEALDAMRRFAVRVLMGEIQRDLDDFRVRFDELYRESSLYEEGRIEGTVDALRETGLVYEHEGAVWLRTREFGDQKDRVMLRGDGTPTYFLPDVAYHVTKWERGFRHVINVQGADHHGTVPRVRAGLRALGMPEGYPEYVLHQMVTVERGGQEVKFSKRAGSYTTLRELFEEVGVDVVRYFFQMRRPEAHLVFDLDVALDQSEKNPVYKVQYAHARMHSIFAKAGVDFGELSAQDAELDRLQHPAERELIKQLLEFPETVGRAASGRAPHILCDYLEQTAGQVNSWYHAGNPSRDPELAVLSPDPALRAARLLLARSVLVVLRNGLRILGITAPKRMERTEGPPPSDATHH
jgi:arginyl-tRNA synthetase